MTIKFDTGFFLSFTASLLNVHEKIRSRPSTWMVAAFLPVSGVESTWDERGGNSNAVRNTELMMECNDCLFEGWNEQTATTHIELWSDQSEVETHFVRVLDKPEGDKMLGDPGVCHTSCVQPITFWNHQVFSLLNKARQSSERLWRSLQNMANIWAVTKRGNANGWAVNRAVNWLGSH